MKEGLGVSFAHTKDLNTIIDTKLTTRRPRFERHEIVVDGEAYEVFFRDVLECVKALWGDREFAPHLVFAPEQHFADEEHTNRLYHNMHTAEWWWRTQVSTSSFCSWARHSQLCTFSD